MVALSLTEAAYFSFEETGPDLLHQGFKRSRCFKVQPPGAAEIRFVRLIRLGRGGSLGQAEHTEAHEGGEPAEQEVPHTMTYIPKLSPEEIDKMIAILHDESKKIAKTKEFLFNVNDRDWLGNGPNLHVPNPIGPCYNV
jgi:hypothetical protein